ncbi:MAG: choice-of-anchor Q domain-containing protein [Rudaea sp.]
MDGDIVDLSGMVTCSTITLQSGEIAATAANLAIVGPTDHTITIDGAGAGRVFDHKGAGTLSLRNLSLQNGVASPVKYNGNGGCVYSTGSAYLYNVSMSGCHGNNGGALNTRATATGAATRVYLSTISGNTADGHGGGIYSKNRLVLQVSTITNNSAAGHGGGLYGEGGIAVHGAASIAHNSAGGRGGGILSGNGSSLLYLGYTSVDHNTAGQDGGGIWSNDNIQIVNSTISSNTASNHGGGGILASGAVTTITGSTVDNNTAVGNDFTASGGGLSATRLGSDVHVLVSNSTIAGNSAYEMGGLWVYNKMGTFDLINSTVAFNLVRTTRGNAAGVGTGSCGVTMQSSIIANNSGGEDLTVYDCFGTQQLNGTYNLIVTSNKAPAFTITANPRLVPLGLHGGLLRTIALLPGSAAIDAGTNVTFLSTDERGSGYPREVGRAADIGAYERQPNDDEIFYAGFQ